MLIFAISSCFSLASLHLAKICAFLRGCPFYWPIVACSSLLWSFVFLCFPCNFFFVSNFLDLRPLFFLMSLAKGLSILFIFSKNQLLVLLIFTFVSFFSIYFCSDLYDFFSSTNFEFYLFCQASKGFGLIAYIWYFLLLTLSGKNNFGIRKRCKLCLESPWRTFPKWWPSPPAQGCCKGEHVARPHLSVLVWGEHSVVTKALSCTSPLRLKEEEFTGGRGS